MRTQSRPYRLTATLAIAGLLLAQLFPQPAMGQLTQPPAGAPDQQSSDPPSRVGRLSQITGTVSFHTQDATAWSSATLNYPVVAGDSFWTQPDAQAGIEVSASLIEMAPQTELDVVSMTDTAFQATLPQGEVYLRVRTATPEETYAVQTPRGLVSLSGGHYSIAAGDTQNPTTITVADGSAQINGPGVTLAVGANQTATVTGTDTFQGSAGPAQRDPFLATMLARDRPPQPQGVAPPAVVAAMPGGDDLSAYGTWADTTDYGNVWYPQVSANWVPYREGYWAYVTPWGWTWVDNDPWGFAPFHYGRWAEIGGRWGWVPGAAVVAGPPVYAPALVTFFGVGAAVGVGIGAALAVGNMGWCPLGPREVYHPWYHASPGYVRNVNITHVSNVTNFTTINRNVTVNNFVNRGAATVVPASVMTGSRPVSGLAQRVDPRQLASARPVFGTQPVRPTATTVGVTPAVARQFQVPATALRERPVAPGPAIRATPAIVSPSAGATGVAHPGLPALHTPGAPAVPAAAAIHPLAGTPPLGAPRTPGAVNPPLIQHGPAGVTPGLAPHPAIPAVVTPPPINHGPAGATPNLAPHPTAPAAIGQPVPQVHTALPPAHPPVPAVAPPPVHTPPPPAQIHPVPEAVHPPVVAQPAPPPPVVHAPPPPAPMHVAAPPPPRPAPSQEKKPGQP